MRLAAGDRPAVVVAAVVVLVADSSLIVALAAVGLGALAWIRGNGRGPRDTYG